MQYLNLTMEIASRIKLYLDVHQIPVTQFADRCGIPRPSLSQLLSGRNKKVSDEVITKIHEAYPSLSMLWLMFGEGEMEYASVNTNVREDAKPQVASATDEQRATRIDFGSEFEKSHTPESPASDNFFTGEQQTDANANDTRIAFTGNTAENFMGKRVVSIVVYYDDKTFESFFPDPKRRSPL